MRRVLTHLAALLLGVLAAIGFFVGWDALERGRRGF